MSIAKGRKQQVCKKRAGVKFIDFAPFDYQAFTVTAGEIATIPAAITEVFRYEVKGAQNVFSSEPTVSKENGTVEYKEGLVAQLSGVSKESFVESGQLVCGSYLAFVHDFNGKVYVGGLTNGLDVLTAPFSTATMSVLVTAEGMESAYPPLLSSAAITALEALVSTQYVTP